MLFLGWGGRGHAFKTRLQTVSTTSWLPSSSECRNAIRRELNCAINKGWSLERNKMRTPLHAANVVFVSRVRRQLGSIQLIPMTQGELNYRSDTRPAFGASMLLSKLLGHLSGFGAYESIVPSPVILQWLSEREVYARMTGAGLTWCEA